MSQENVEIVKGVVRAFNMDGVSAAASMLEVYDPSIEFLEDPNMPEAGVYRGFEAVGTYFSEFLDSFDDYAYEIEEIIDAGDVVLVFNRQHGHGKSSGVEVEMRNCWVFRLHQGRITQIRSYWDRAQALAAAELLE